MKRKADNGMGEKLPFRFAIWSLGQAIAAIAE